MRRFCSFLVFYGVVSLLAGCATLANESPSFQSIKYPYPDGQYVWSNRAKARIYLTQIGKASLEQSSLILLHPWGGNMVIWKDLAEKLSKNHHVVLIDLPGHGKSGKPVGRYPPKRMAFATLDVIDALRLTNPILLGNSLGGATAIEVALQAPKKIGAITLLGAPGGSQHPQVIRRFVRSLTHPKNVQTVAPSIVHFLWWMVAQTFNPTSSLTVETTWVQARGSKEWPLFARAVSQALAELMVWSPPVEQIQVPALIIQGSTDLVVWPWLGKELGQRIEGSQYEHLDRCGHFPQLQCLEKLLTILNPFLLRHNSSQRK